MSESKKSAEQVEREQMTRRQALRKFGFAAGMSAIMLLGVDDLARMVGERMRQMDGDNKVADQIAKEFQSAGVTLASGGGGTAVPACGAWESEPHTQSQCENCQYGQVINKCYGQTGVTHADCDGWASQCDKFCATGNYNDWWNCWNGFNSAMP